MRLGRRHFCGALALLTAIIALTASWFAAMRTRQSATGATPAADSFFPSAKAATSGVDAVSRVNAAAPFAAHQTPTVRGTAPYRIALANPAGKAAALMRIRRSGARVIGPYSPSELLVETSAWALARMADDNLFSGSREVLPDEKIAAGFAGGPAVIIALSGEDVPRIEAWVLERGGEIVAAGPRPRHSIVANIDLATARELAARGEVRWIERRPELKTRNDCAIVDTGVAAVRQSLGLTGAGETVATADTGIDTGEIDTLHPDFGRRIVAIDNLGGYVTADRSGHGTHTAGTIAGDGAASQDQYAGVAPGAKLFVQACGDDAGSRNIYFNMVESYSDIFAGGLSSGAYIHSDSWGGNANAYDALAQGLDYVVWSHPELLVVVANGNSGAAPGTVGTPATAKNCLSVGSAYSSRSQVASGTLANSSSRGPCSDGRIKPDLVAPGVGIVSTRSSLSSVAKFDEEGYYARMSGTSMATPHVAGAAALVREWLRVRRGFSGEPTAALLKAILTGGALHDGQPPDNNRGWGMLDLDETLSPTNRQVRLIDRVPFGAGVEQRHDFALAQQCELDVQLCWIDYPALPEAALAIVNDLDLVVTNLTTGACWFGNGVSGGDRTNNVESVRIADAPAGDYAVIVRSVSVCHSSLEGGAAALYLRGAFEGTAEDVSDDSIYLTVDAENGDDETADGSAAAPYATIAAAVAAAPAGAQVLVKAGVYAPFAAGERAVRVVGVDGHAVTFIDGSGVERCFTATGNELAELQGFTLLNGRADYGAGARGGFLTACVISNCIATAGGGGACESLLENCLVAGNAVESSDAAYGGGVYISSLIGSTVVGNRATGVSRAYGGGCYCDSKLGGYAVNSIISGNQAEGASVYGADSYDDAGKLIKCHIGDGAGFVDAANGDWHLAAGSPCIDAGFSDCALTDADLEGNRRISGARIDFGCFEYVQQVAFSGSERWCSNAAQSFAVTLVADGEWQIASSADWLSAEPASGIGTTTVRCRVAANADGAERTAILQADGSGADAAAVLRVGQVAAPPRKGGVRYGVFVGLNEYDPAFVSSYYFLRGCVNDALAYRACAIGSGMMRRDNAWVLTNAVGTKAAIRARLNALAAVAKAGDTVVYAHSSHGVNAVSDPQLAAVCAYDDFYRDYELAADLANFDRAAKVIVIIDACHSAAMANSSSSNFAAGVLSELRQLRIRSGGGVAAQTSDDDDGQVAFIVAADFDQYSLEGSANGQFTQAFTNGWLSGLAEADGDGRLNFRELFDFAAIRASGNWSDPWQRTEPQCFNEPLLLTTLAEMVDPAWPDPGVVAGDTPEDIAAKVSAALAAAGIDERLSALVWSVEQYLAIAWWMATMEVSAAEFNAAAMPLFSAAMGAEGMLAPEDARIGAVKVDWQGGRCRLRIALPCGTAGRIAETLLPAAVAVEGTTNLRSGFSFERMSVELVPGESGLEIVATPPDGASSYFMRTILR